MKFKTYDKAARKLTHHTIEVTTSDNPSNTTRKWTGTYTVTNSEIRKDKDPVENSRIVYDFFMTLVEDTSTLDQ